MPKRRTTPSSAPTFLTTMDSADVAATSSPLLFGTDRVDAAVGASTADLRCRRSKKTAEDAVVAMEGHRLDSYASMFQLGTPPDPTNFAAAPSTPCWIAASHTRVCFRPSDLTSISIA